MSAAKAAPPKKGGNRSFITIVVLTLIIGAAAIAYIVGRSKPAVITLDPNAPLPAPQGYLAGSPSAPVEIVEFGDFECPACGQFATITEPDVRTRLVNAGLARFRYVDFPWPQHPSTMFAHNAAACANAQGKFWPMHDRIYLGQWEWSQFANGRDMNAPKVLKRYAKELGLDAAAFATCFDSRQFEAQIRANQKEGERLGVRGTPWFIVGKRLINVVPPYDMVKAVVDSATADAAQAARDSAAGKKATSSRGGRG